MSSPAEVFDDCAEEYARQFMDLSPYHASLDRLCDAVETPDAGVLDVACGPGNIASYLLAKRPAFRVLGIDLAPNMLRLARLHCPGATFRRLDARHIRRLRRKFDAVTCGFCLPYLSKDEAVTLVADASSILRRSGVLYLSALEDDHAKSRLTTSSDGRHQLFMYFHEAGYLTAALVDHGFELLDLHRQAGTGPGGTPATELILLAKLTGS